MQRLADVHLLVAIVTLSEELDFTRAAKRLGISQSGRTISTLETKETKNRIKLFERDHVKSVLTEAGRVFVEGGEAFASP